MTSAFYISAVLLGLAANFHCIGMCGPLVLTLPLERAENKWKAAGIYMISKAFGYGLLGVFAGLISFSFSLISLQRSFFLAMGCLLIFLSLKPALKLAIATPAVIKNGISHNLSSVFQNPSPSRFFISGLLNAFIPCGMIYAALASAAAANSVAGSTIYMVIFGVAAGPGLYALMLFKSRLNYRFLQRLKTFSSIIIFLTGAFLIWRSFLPVQGHAHKKDALMELCIPG